MLNAGKYNKKISIYQVEKKEDESGFKKEDMPEIQNLFDRLLTTEKERIKANVFDKIAEIDAKRPVLYGAQDDNNNGGHAFVLDGYKYDNNKVKYHINWEDKNS